jgi:hypothetical protein
MRDILCPGVYLKSNEKGSIFKFKESGESIIATTLKYRKEPIKPTCYSYLSPFDLLYIVWENKIISYSSNGNA